ncbi:MAG TPA: ATP-binding protein [Gemmatimonadaceae bacterium]|nr:ATP-binding protein [Gemmatimonadaceae bacterium]
MITAEDLRVIEILADLPDDDRQWIAERCEEQTAKAGEIVFVPGTPAEYMYFLLAGALEWRRVDRQADAPNFVARAGATTGRIPFSRMKTIAGQGRALTDARAALFPASQFAELLQRIPALEPRLVSLLTDRVRETERREHEYERFRLLGRISAGMAHELNNPVAAARQASTELRDRIDAIHRFTIEMVQVGVDAAALEGLNRERLEVASRRPVVLDPVERSEREEAMTNRLAEAGVPEPWVSAATFVGAGITCDELRDASDCIPEPALKPVLCWMAAAVATDTLVREVSQATARVSDLVNAVKAYTQMDRPSAKEFVDVRKGIEASLAIFQQRLEEKHITISRQFAELPQVSVYAGELNQVWANLISNAIDAVDMGGHITLMGCRDGASHVRIDVMDDGVGIPEDLQERVWEPFFTTKEVGQGTGLGLDIVRRIVVRRHEGTVTLQSSPGSTVFTVILPVN